MEATCSKWPSYGTGIINTSYNQCMKSRWAHRVLTKLKPSGWSKLPHVTHRALNWLLTPQMMQVSKTRAEKQFWLADGFSFVKNPISSCDFIQTVHHVVLLVFMFLVFGRWSDCTVLLQYEVMSCLLWLVGLYLHVLKHFSHIPYGW